MQTIAKICKKTGSHLDGFIFFLLLPPVLKISSFVFSLGGFQSGQMGQTVNLLAFAFGGSNPSPPTFFLYVRK